MKKILVTFSLICFVAFASNAQTSPTTAKVATTSKEVKADAKAEAVAAPEAKKYGCCHKGASSADCKNKSMKDCSTKSSAESKSQKSSATKGGTN